MTKRLLLSLLPILAAALVFYTLLPAHGVQEASAQIGGGSGGGMPRMPGIPGGGTSPPIGYGSGGGYGTSGYTNGNYGGNGIPSIPGSGGFPNGFNGNGFNGNGFNYGQYGYNTSGYGGSGWNPPESKTQATSNLETQDSNGNRRRCSELPEAKGGVLLGRIVPCLAYTIENATKMMAQKLIDLFKPIFYSFLTLVVIFFGIKVLQGERELNAAAFAFIFKIAIVIGMFEIIPNIIIPSTYGIISDGVLSISSVIGPDSSNPLSCDVESYGDENTPLIWKQMDCVLGKLYGFATGTGNTGPDGSKPVNMVLASSAVGLLTGFFFGGTLGVTVFFALVGVLWTIIMLVLRTVLAFMNGYLIVCVLLIISPIFMPLLLLKATSRHFDKWWKAILGGLMLPIIIAGYSVLALQLYDAMLFKPDSKLQTLFKYDAVQNAMELPRKPCDMPITNDPKFKGKSANADEGELSQIINNPYIKSIAQPLLTAGSDACGLFSLPSFDVTKVKGKGFENQKEAMLELFKTCIELFIIAYLIAEGVEAVQATVSSFTGSSLTGVAMSTRSKMENEAMGKFEHAKSNMTRSLSTNPETGEYDNAGGAQFLKRTPGALAEFLGGVKR